MSRGILDMLVYKYLPLEHAISSIHHARIKLSTVHELNDVFDLMPCLTDGKGRALPDSEARKWFKGTEHPWGILCFAAVFSCPVLWNHYATQHRGVVFEWDLPDNSVTKVTYRNKRVKIPLAKANSPSDLKPLFKALVLRKAKGWAHEQEYRATIPITSNTIMQNGLFFEEVDKQSLKRVILGFKCPMSKNAMQCILASSGFVNTTVTSVEPSDSEFKMEIKSLP